MQVWVFSTQSRELRTGVVGVAVCLFSDRKEGRKEYFAHIPRLLNRRRFALKLARGLFSHVYLSG